jgi:CBS domain-containing protein
MLQSRIVSTREPSRQLRARDIMTRHVITAAPEAKVKDLALLMANNRISGVPIVTAEGDLVGIVTEGDLLYKELLPKPPEPAEVFQHLPLPSVAEAAERARKAEGLSADAIMTSPVITVDEDTPVHAVVAEMVKRRINRLPVVRQGRMTGIISRADVLRVFTRPDPEISEAVWKSISHDLPIDVSSVMIEVLDGMVYLYGTVTADSDKTLLERWSAMVDGVIGVQSWLTTEPVDPKPIGRAQTGHKKAS